MVGSHVAGDRPGWGTGVAHTHTRLPPPGRVPQASPPRVWSGEHAGGFVSFCFRGTGKVLAVLPSPEWPGTPRRMYWEAQHLYSLHKWYFF